MKYYVWVHDSIKNKIVFDAEVNFEKLTRIISVIQDLYIGDEYTLGVERWCIKF